MHRLLTTVFVLAISATILFCLPARATAQAEPAPPEAAANAPAPIYLWFEPEWFEGVKGSFNYWPGFESTKPSGAWGIAGPGVTPEFSQGGESEWNSMGAPAAETAASCQRDLVIPAAGRYRVWVRYVDHRDLAEPIT